MEASLKRTHSLIGHPNYWAPEFLDQKGYGVLVDLWALGVCLFEMTLGYLPFGSDSDDTYTILSKINRDSLEFPEWFSQGHANSNFINFVSNLLNKNPKQRLGPKWSGKIGDYSCLLHHEYLMQFDYYKFKKEQLEPPLKPLATAKFKKEQLLDFGQMEVNFLEDPENDLKTMRIKNRQNLDFFLKRF